MDLNPKQLDFYSGVSGHQLLPLWDIDLGKDHYYDHFWWFHYFGPVLDEVFEVLATLK